MRRIGTLEEGQSRGRVREIYLDAERSFAVPFVGAVFRALAVQPNVLEQVWPQVKSNVEAQTFVNLSSRLRQRSDMLAETTFELVDLYAWLRDHGFPREDIRRILYILELFHQLDPKLLICTAAMTVAVTGISNPEIRRRRFSPIRTPQPEFPTRIPQVMIEQAPDEVKEDYLDIADVMGLPVIPDEFQTLGHWPPFLRRVWNELKPVTRSHTFLNEAENLEAVAIEMAQELPCPVKIENPTDDTRRILETFMSIYARMNLVISAVRWMMIEGERLARSVGRAAGERRQEYPE